MTRAIRTLVCAALLGACHHQPPPKTAPTEAAPLNEAAPSDAEVLDALAQRSKLAPDVLRDFLSHCDDDQQSMYFCAYRDVVANELLLNRVLAAKQKALPECSSQIADEILRWQAARNESCVKSAQDEYGGGSMEPTARNICMAAETERFTKALHGLSSCQALASFDR